jgi:hypothetical protein
VHGDPVARYHQNGVLFDHLFKPCGGKLKRTPQESIALASAARHRNQIARLTERAQRAEGVLGNLGPATMPRETVQARKENARALAAERLADDIP